MRFVIAIADNQLNVSSAAKALYTSQPGVSRQLRLMEEELNVVIYERKGKQIISITEEGQHILVALREIIEKVDQIKLLTKNISEKQNNTIHFKSEYAIAI
jgi:LysR family cys regulon transcriptional activator